MSDFFHMIKREIEKDSKKDNKIFYRTYWLGFIHGMSQAGAILPEEEEELTDYKNSLIRLEGLDDISQPENAIKQKGNILC